MRGPTRRRPDDCEDAALWLLAGRCGRAGEPERLPIGGESAGGHLSALDACCACAAVAGRRSPRRTSSSAPSTSRGTPSARAWGDRYLVLSGPIIDWFGDQYLPGLSSDARRDPAISPLYADLAGLPPALFTVGDQDPLLDDTLFMHARWTQAGNAAELDVIDEAIHAFNDFDLEIAHASEARQAAFLVQTLGL